MNPVLKEIGKALIPNNVLVFKGKRERAKIALTFDDGPNTTNLVILLRLLKQEAVKATFFLSGELVEKHPTLVKMIDESGHEIANHFYHHRPIHSLSVACIKREVDRTEQAILSLTGKSTKFIRPPYGGVTLPLFYYCFRYNKTIVLWTNDGKDCSAKSLTEVTARLSLEEVTGGEILLFHEDSEFLLKSVVHTINFLKDKGFDFAPVGEIL